LKALVKRGDATPQEIRDAFVLYHTSKGKPYSGLWTRRADEADMYLDGDYRRKFDRPLPEGINFK
jgi:GH24 family phage-related lysozyme (muramidase)